MAGIILDTIDVMFVCYAVDKDNGVDMTNEGFHLLVMEMPNKVEMTKTDFIPQGGSAGMLNFAQQGQQQQGYAPQQQQQPQFQGGQQQQFQGGQQQQFQQQQQQQGYQQQGVPTYNAQAAPAYN